MFISKNDIENQSNLFVSKLQELVVAFHTTNLNIDNLIFKGDIWKDGVMIDTFVENFDHSNSFTSNRDETEVCSLFLTNQIKFRSKGDLEEIEVKVLPFLLERE
jgi:hypothetical protein